ncbi:urease subunit beta [Candidatus Nitrososphaera sp. FF02]|uniref:urease subunit beta n=1 Tax=Candidatus Nitrososphaera sp. FF02 TaxID=3398226 RepID=UPI0039E9C93B
MIQLIPGEYFISDRQVVANAGRKTARVRVSNTGNRPVQVGSHTHFFEVNKALEFPREKAYGFHLNIPAGTSLRFEPGDTREVELVEYVGRKIVYGFSGLVNGKLSIKKKQAMARAKARRFKGA